MDSLKSTATIFPQPLSTTITGFTIDEWIKKIWHRYTFITSAIKKDEILSFLITQMELKFIMLTEISKAHKVK